MASALPHTRKSDVPRAQRRRCHFSVRRSICCASNPFGQQRDLRV